MEKPTLEEVKEYFKNAETVECAQEKVVLDITKNITEDVHFWYGSYWISFFENYYEEGSVLLWSNDDGYAKILTYKKPEVKKEKTFVITEAFLKAICQEIELNQSSAINRIKEKLPQAFKEEKKEVVLEVGKWYKNPNVGSLALCKEIIYNESFYGYGFGSDNCGNEWFDMSDVEFTCNNWIEATPQEVAEALEKEAVKRGFKEGTCFLDVEFKEKQICHNEIEICKNTAESETGLQFGILNGLIFYNGIWAEIIPTITIKEAEEKLNNKFKIVQG